MGRLQLFLSAAHYRGESGSSTKLSLLLLIGANESAIFPAARVYARTIWDSLMFFRRKHVVVGLAINSLLFRLCLCARLR